MKQSVMWPPPSKPSEPKPPSSKKMEKVRIKEPEKSEPKIPTFNVEDVDELIDKKKKMSLCSEEVSLISDKNKEKLEISTICEDSNRPRSPLPDKDVICLVNEISKAQVRSRSAERREISSSQIYEEQSFKSESVRKSRKDHYTSSSSTKIEMESSESRTVGGLRRSVSPEVLDVSSKPHEVKSLLPPASAVRPLSPMQVVVFPPQIPDVIRSHPTTPQPPAVTELIVKYSSSPTSKITEDRISKCRREEEIKHIKEKKEHISKENKKTAIMDKKSTKKEKIKNEKSEIQEKKESRGSEKLFTKTEVEKIVEEELKKALKSSSKVVEVEESKMIEITDLPAPIVESGKMASALSVAPDKPFTPVPFPKPLELPSVVEKPRLKKPVSNHPVPLPPYSKPYFPPPPPPPERETEHENVARAFREVGCRSPMTEALTIASDRPYSPLPAITKIESNSVSDMNAFKPIGDMSKNKPQMTMLSALTVAPNVPFTLPGKTPIPSDQKLDDKTLPSAFKPLNGSVSGVIPKTAPLNKDPLVPYIPHPKVDSKFGLDKSSISEPGIKKETIRGFESTTATSDTARYSRKAEFICESSKSQSQHHQEAKTEIARPITPRQSKPASGLHGPNLLPYYQANIGEIPVRNRSISPVPHLIKAPSMAPTVLPPRSPLTVSRAEAKSNMSSVKQRQQMYDKSLDKHSEETSTSYSQKSMLSSETTSSTKTITNINKTKQVFKPSAPVRQLSPHWKGEYVRAVQNLSPITVRLPSPVPHPSKPVGETSQQAGAKIVIKKNKRGQSPLVTYEPDVDSSSSKCATGKKCSSGKGCSETETCSESQCEEKCDSTSARSSSITSSKQSQQRETLQQKEIQHMQQKQVQQTLQQKETQHNTQQMQVQHAQQSSYSSQQQILSQQKNQLLSSADISKGKNSESFDKQYSSTSSHSGSFSNYGHEIDTQSKGRTSYSSGNYSSNTAMSSSQSGIPIPIPNIPKPSTRSLCGVNPSSLGGHAGGGIGSGGRSGTVAGSSAPRRGRGVLNTSVPPGGRIPLCGHCNNQIRYFKSLPSNLIICETL